ERLERRGIVILVRVVLVNRLAHLVQILEQHGFLGVLDAIAVDGQPDPRKDRDDHHDDHQLDEREAVLSPHYQSRYLVPSSPMAALRVYTSYTLCPPQLDESGLS